MKVKIKKLHPDAVIPKKAHADDAGFDLTAVAVEYPKGVYLTKYSFGIAIEIPKNHVGLIFPRSSVWKTDQLLSNSVGVIDCGYTGEISAIFHGTGYKVGDRVAQLIIMPIPSIEFEEVETLEETPRGAGGYGSTGK